jgi:predicted nucleotidyltransferase component of viral defense system
MIGRSSTDFSEIRRIAITAVFSDDLLFDRVVLKGGNALSLALRLSDRTSLDLDFSIENDFENVENIAARLQKALERRFTAAGFVVFDFKFESKPSIPREGQNPR